MCFDVKFYLSRKSHLVTGRKMQAIYDNYIFGVVNIYIFRTSLFFVKIYKLDMDTSCFRNYYIRGIAKENIHTMEGPGKYKLDDIMNNEIVTKDSVKAILKYISPIRN